MSWLTWIHGEPSQARREAFDTGDEVRVWFKLVEQGKEWLGQFEGVVLRVRGAGPERTLTVRRVTHGEGVERVFPIDSQAISRIEVLRHGRPKRSRLYFLRTAVGKTRIAPAQTRPTEERPPARTSTGDSTQTTRAAGAAESAVIAGERTAHAVPGVAGGSTSSTSSET